MYATTTNCPDWRCGLDVCGLWAAAVWRRASPLLGSLHCQSLAVRRALSDGREVRGGHPATGRSVLPECDIAKLDG